MFNSASPIWLKCRAARADEFASFYGKFDYKGGECHLYITAGADYNVYIGGSLVTFGQYPDYPRYKFYDCVAIDTFLTSGINDIRIDVWYYGIDSQTYIKSEAYVCFEIVNERRVVLSSGKDTLSRAHENYVPHLCKNITGQLGLAWRYDATGNKTPLSTSREVGLGEFELSERPIKKLTLESEIEGFLVEKGGFTADDMNAAGAALMQNAVFSQKFGDGTYYIYDLGKENVGFPCFSFGADGEYEVLIGWGEHLSDGRCRTSVRNFCCEYKCKLGKNEFLGSFRRFGCRYIQLFCKGGALKNVKVGLRPTLYPQAVKTHKFEGLRKRIYDTAVHTLICCMHDHYEDCPWREQALYTLDSRNQMLCGYYAFGSFEFARASLRLMSHGVRPDGLMNLCFPAGLDFPIPSYSLAYFLQIEEYFRYSQDMETVETVFLMLERLMRCFTDKMAESVLINGFEGFWNFYEWAPTMSGNMHDDGKAVEAPLNAFLVLALDAMSRLCRVLSKDPSEYEERAEKLKKSLRDTFFNEETLLFESYSDRAHGKYSVLTNSLCLLCGAADTVDKSVILSILETNGEGECGLKLIPNTLSMNSFRFDALLREDREKYAKVILDELDREYGKMLDAGATSFWETAKGESDFRGAGSLCHGWSALPIYYYNILCDL